ncbi:MAG: aldo/keto reductase, partial [Hyphomicrobiales bacterium]
DHRAKHRLFQPEIYSRVQKAVEDLKPIAKRNNATLAQLALAWVISHPSTCAIAGARNAAQAAENARAAHIQLSEADRSAMELISRSVTDLMDDNPVQWNF